MPLEVNALTFIRIAFVCLMVAACQYRPRNFDGSNNGDGTETHAPIAAIRSATADGRLVLPESGNAPLDGTASSDPDGDVLTYAWTFDANCGAPPTGEVLTQPAFTVDAATLSSGCRVTLTVTDTAGLTGSASVVVEHRAIGGYVARVSGCREAYDDARTDAQGTREVPFCSFSAVADALSVNAIADVFIAVGLYDEPETLALPAASYHGGYDPQAWTRDPTQISRIRGMLRGAADPVLRLSSGGTVLLQSIGVQRDVACAVADCGTVEITGTDVNVDRFSVLAPFDTSSPATPGRVVGVSVEVSSTGGASFRGSDVNVTIGGSESSIGILATGPVSVDLERVALNMAGSGSLVIGVWGRTSASITLKTPAIVLNGAPATGFGVLGGSSDVFGIDGCSGTNVVCDASGPVLLNGGNITVAATTNAFGVAVAGASMASLRDTVVISGAWRATGVHTLGVASVLLTAPDVTSRFVDNVQSGSPFVIAYRDGTLGSSGTSMLGAAIITANGGSYSAQTLDPTLATLAFAIGMELDGTQSGRVAGAEIEVYGAPSGTVRANTVYAAATRETRLLGFADVAFRIARSITANNDIAAFADGDANAIAHGSAVLTLEGNSYNARLVGSADGTHRSCVVLAKTTTGTLLGPNTLTCSSEMFANQSDTTFSVGLWTLATTDTTVTSASISMGELAAIPPSAHATMWLIGILDGVIPDKSGIQPSNGLVIDRADILIPVVDTAKALGVYLRGFNASFTKPVLINGHIDVSAASQAIGVAVERRGAVIAHNTITFGQCVGASCAGTGVGLQLLNTSNHGVVVRANNFTVGGRSNSALSPAILDGEDAANTVGMTNLVFNVWGGFASGAAQPHDLYRRQSTAPVPPVQPVPGDEARSEAQLSTIGARNNIAGTTLFCNTRPGYLARQSPGTDASTESLTADMEVGARLSSDFDGVARAASPYDIGADERTCSNP